MYRWLVRTCVFLFLGAIVNVAVAWGIMVWTPDVGVYRNSIIVDPAARHWPKGSPADWPHPGYGEQGGTRALQYEMYSHSTVDNESDEGGSEEWDALRLQAGWPTFGMVSAQYSHVLTVGESKEVWNLRRGRVLPNDQSWPPRILPFLPIWPGFAINTVFYAAILWLLIAAPFALRRRMRIKRGLCTKCAYDLHAAPTDSIACPECGAISTRCNTR